MKKEYTNEELTIVWQADKCIHAATCIKMLPKVYNPKARPWVTIENAATQELISQIDQCPSGALSYYRNEKPTETTTSTTPNVSVEILPNGPLLVKGTIDLKNQDGSIETKGKMTAFCRCGASLNKPFCDGAHAKIEFEG